MRFSEQTPTLHATWRAAIDAVIVFDRKGHIVDWNERAKSLFRVEGFRNICDLVSADHVDLHNRHLHECCFGKGPQLCTLSGRSGDGRELTVLCSVDYFEENQHGFFVEFFRSVDESTKESKVLGAIIEINRAEDLDELHRRCVGQVAELGGFDGVHVFAVDGEELIPTNQWAGDDLSAIEPLVRATEGITLARGEGIPGTAWDAGSLQEFREDGISARFARRLGPKQEIVKHSVCFPILARGRIVGVVECYSRCERRITSDVLKALEEIGDQAGLVFDRLIKDRKLRSYAETLEDSAETLNYQIKNIISVICGLALHTAVSSETVQQFLPRFEGRLESLLRAHRVLAPTQWTAVGLHDIIEIILSDAVSVKGGPFVRLTTQEALTMAIVLHELETNARRHGCIGTGGRVDVSWQIVNDMTEMVWEEEGITVEADKVRSSFGSRLINEIVSHQIEGRTHLNIFDHHLRWTVSFPATLTE